MHELSLAQATVEQLERVLKAEGGGFSRIERLHMEIGGMSGVDREAFEFVFPAAAEGTVAESAALIFTEVPLRLHCNACGADSVPEYPSMFCEACGGADVDIAAGRDFKILSMEVS